MPRRPGCRPGPEPARAPCQPRSQAGPRRAPPRPASTRLPPPARAPPPARWSLTIGRAASERAADRSRPASPAARPPRRTHPGPQRPRPHLRRHRQRAPQDDPGSPSRRKRRPATTRRRERGVGARPGRPQQDGHQRVEQGRTGQAATGLVRSTGQQSPEPFAEPSDTERPTRPRRPARPAGPGATRSRGPSATARSRTRRWPAAAARRSVAVQPTGSATTPDSGRRPAMPPRSQ